MTVPQIHGRRSSFSANVARAKLGEALSTIRDDDKLTWDDIGRVLGKHRDRAAAYAGGAGDMGVISFLLGCREWNGRFAGDVFGLIGMKLVELETGDHSDRHSLTALTRLLLQMSVALEDDDEIDEDELAEMRRAIEDAGSSIDRMRERLKFRTAAVK